jgi:hypothetical protein
LRRWEGEVVATRRVCFPLECGDPRRFGFSVFFGAKNTKAATIAAL